MRELKFLFVLFILAACQVDLFPFAVESGTGNVYVYICLYVHRHTDIFAQTLCFYSEDIFGRK